MALVEPSHTERSQGYFSLIRWRPDLIRDESRNVAVVLVDQKGTFGGVRSAPVSTISPSLHDQGIVDAVISSITDRFASEAKPTLGILNEWHDSMQESLYITPPKAVSVADPTETLETLYKLYVRPTTSLDTNAT